MTSEGSEVGNETTYSKGDIPVGGFAGQTMPTKLWLMKGVRHIAMMDELDADEIIAAASRLAELQAEHQKDIDFLHEMHDEEAARVYPEIFALNKQVKALQEELDAARAELLEFVRANAFEAYEADDIVMERVKVVSLDNLLAFADALAATSPAVEVVAPEGGGT